MNYTTYYSQAQDKWFVYDVQECRDLCSTHYEKDARDIADAMNVPVSSSTPLEDHL